MVVGFLASGVLGLVRTAVFSTTFGASAALDAFYAAQRIPETLFVLVAGGALGSSFIPVFTRLLDKPVTPDSDPGADAWRLASATLTLASVAAALIAVVIGVFAPLLVPAVLVPGAHPAEQALTTALTQMMLVTVVIFSVSGLLMGLLNARGIFMLPALAPSMNNLGQIFGALVLTRLITTYGVDPAVTVAEPFAAWGASFWPSDGGAATYGLALGTILGALLHLIIQLPGLPHVGARLRVLLAPRTPGVREVLLLMGPRVLGLAVVQINFIVNINLTSGMIAGSRTALITAWTLMFFALGVIAQGVGTAVFPTLSALAAADNLPGYRDRLASALRSVLFLAFPATVGLIVLGEPLIALLFQYGAWDAESTAATAWALSFFALGIAGHGLLEVLSRAFYALSDTWTPVGIGLASMVANIILSLIFIQFIGDPSSLRRGPFAGLALANSLTTILEGLALWVLLRRRIGGLNDRVVLRGAIPALLAALIMGLAILLIADQLAESGPLLTVAVGGLSGMIVFFGLAILLGVSEARAVPMRVLQRLRGRTGVSTENT
ncbi:MAG: murein biosynthesis integral membrane protein MurJ [Chloroflexi bacterium]|nr:murein biosynthesis integral membrane protein MurJ [Chloroflexota bacterium]